MAHQNIEEDIGLYPPFLIGSILSEDKRSNKTSRSFKYRALENDCSRFVIEAISSPYSNFKITGYITNDHTYMPISLDTDNTIVLNSCYDVLTLFLRAFDDKEDTGKIFTFTFHPCGKWGCFEIIAKEMGYIKNEYVTRGSGSLRISVFVENIRNGHHYGATKQIDGKKTPSNDKNSNTNSDEDYVSTEEASTTQIASFNSQEFLTEENLCLICFRKYLTTDLLIDHVNFQHPTYKMEAIYGNSGRCILCYSKEEDSEMSGEDFTFLRANYKGRNAQLVNSEAVPFKDKFRFHLCDKITTKSGKQFNILFHKNYLIKVPVYPLDTRMQIEKEYDISLMHRVASTTDEISRKLEELSLKSRSTTTRDSLIVHLNKRLSGFVIKPADKKIMEVWNELKSKDLLVADVLHRIFKQFGIVEETLRLTELIYTQGVITSSEIIAILNKIDIEKELTSDDTIERKETEEQK